MLTSKFSKETLIVNRSDTRPKSLPSFFISKKEKSKRFILVLFPNRNKQERTGDAATPPGYNPSVVLAHSTESLRESDSNHLIIKKSWDLALGPLKQVPMNLFIMYMAGNSISIFPIMMVGMLIIRPIKALFTLQQSQYRDLSFLFLKKIKKKY